MTLIGAFEDRLPRNMKYTGARLDQNLECNLQE